MKPGRTVRPARLTVSASGPASVAISSSSPAATMRPEPRSIFFSSRSRDTRCGRDWSSDVCSSDLRGDYPAARAALLEALASYDRTGPLSEALAVRRELAGALAAAGDLQGALDQLHRAEHLADSARAPPGVRAGIALAHGDLALQLNTLAEADRRYAQAALLYRRGGEPGGGAAARQGGGGLFLERANSPPA